MFLGRGIVAARAASPGLAVRRRPAVRAPPARARVPPDVRGRPPARRGAAAGVPLRPLAGTDLQVLVGLRICLAVLILLSLGSMAFNFVNFGRFGSSVAIQLTLRSVLGLLPPVAVLVAVSVRNPPAGAALDAVAGFGIASILFRFGYLGFAGVFTSGASASRTTCPRCCCGSPASARSKPASPDWRCTCAAASGRSTRPP